MFEFVTGILNIQTYYKFPGSFYPLHFYGAWVFIAGFVVHVTLKWPVMIKALRSRNLIMELRTGVAGTRPEPRDAGSLVAPRPEVLAGLCNNRTCIKVIAPRTLSMKPHPAGRPASLLILRASWRRAFADMLGSITRATGLSLSSSISFPVRSLLRWQHTTSVWHASTGIHFAEMRFAFAMLEEPCLARFRFPSIAPFRQSGRVPVRHPR